MVHKLHTIYERRKAFYNLTCILFSLPAKKKSPYFVILQKRLSHIMKNSSLYTWGIVRLPLSGTGSVVGAKERTGTHTALLGQDLFTVPNLILSGGIWLEGMFLSALAPTIPRVITPLLLLTRTKEKNVTKKQEEMHFLFCSFLIYF